MKRWLLLSTAAAFFLTQTAVKVQGQQNAVHGCYQKNDGQLRIVPGKGECAASELAVSWPPGRSASAASNGSKQPRSRRITALQTLGGAENAAYAINDHGEIVGFSSLAGDTATHAFLYRMGVVSDLSPINSGVIQTVGPTGINNHGTIASGFVNGGVYVPLLFDSLRQRITTLGSFGGVTSFGFSGVATSVNNRDDAVGYLYINENNRHAFLYSNGVLKDIGSFGGFSVATDINDPGAIVGVASNLFNGAGHAFLYSNGVMKDINPFGGAVFDASESAAQAINNRGVVVGEGFHPSGSFRAFLYHNGSVTDLGVLPDGRNSYGKGINDPGAVVGTADVPYSATCFNPSTGQYVSCIQYKLTAFLYENGVMKDLNSLIPADSGWELISAFDINNRGQIVGSGLLNGNLRAFLLN